MPKTKQATSSIAALMRDIDLCMLTTHDAAKKRELR